MKPRIHFRVRRKALSIKIKIHGTDMPPAEFNTGVKANVDLFEGKKQISGEPTVQLYMTKTKETLESLFMPGMSPEALWITHIGKIENTDIHTVKDAFDYYLAQIHLAPSTKETIETTRDKVWASGLLDSPLRNLTPAMVREFLNNLQGMESTVYLAYIQFKTVLNRYIKDHHLNIILPLDGLLRAPKAKQTVEGEEEYLTLQEVQDLLKVDLKDNPKVEYARDLFCLMAFTGLAVGDLGDFKLKWISEDGKWLTYFRKKNGQKCEIPILPITHELIYKHPWPCRISDRTMQYHCKAISNMVGKRVTPHSARHSWGCIALEFGFSMESVSRMLGHASIRVTEKIYAKVTKQKIEREMRELPASIRELMKID